MNTKYFVLFLAIGFLLSSCSDNMLTRSNATDSQTSSQFSSRIPIPTPTAENKDTDVAISNSVPMHFLTAQTMVYYDSAQQPRYNAIRLWIPKINSDFQNGNYQIQFYKSKATPQGDVYTDPNALQVRMEKRAYKTNASDYMNSINWVQMSDSLKTLSVTTTDMAKIFTDYSFVVLLDKLQGSTNIPYALDPSVDYDVLIVAIYKDSKLIEEKKSLLPAFYAHPKAYAEGKPQALIQLHPFADQTNSSWPAAHFAELLNANRF